MNSCCLSLVLLSLVFVCFHLSAAGRFWTSGRNNHFCFWTNSISNGQTHYMFLHQTKVGEEISFVFFDSTWNKENSLVECITSNNHAVIKSFSSKCWKDRGRLFSDIPDGRFNISRLIEPDGPCVDVGHLPELRLPVRRARDSKTVYQNNGETFQKLKRSKRAWMIPGTLWCGSGNKASDFSDLGLFEDTDKCCREHDHCEQTIASFEFSYGVFNGHFFTLSHCDCDSKFRRCLHNANDRMSDMVGYGYFNVLKMRCFEFSQRMECAERSWWGMCKHSHMTTYALFRDAIDYNSTFPELEDDKLDLSIHNTVSFGELTVTNDLVMSSDIVTEDGSEKRSSVTLPQWLSLTVNRSQQPELHGKPLKTHKTDSEQKQTTVLPHMQTTDSLKSVTDSPVTKLTDGTIYSPNPETTDSSKRETTNSTKTTHSTNPAITDSTKTTDSTNPAITDSTKTTDSTNPAITDLTKTTDSTNPAKTDSTKTTDSTNPAITDLTKTTDSTNPAITDLTKTTDSTNPAITDSTKTTDSTGPAITDSTKTTDSTDPAITDSTKTTDSTGPAITDSTKTTDSTNPAITDSTNPAITDLTKTTDSTNPAITDLTKTTDSTNPAITDLSETTDLTNPAIIDLTKTEATDSTNPAITNLTSPETTDFGETQITELPKRAATDSSKADTTDSLKNQTREVPKTKLTASNQSQTTLSPKIHLHPAMQTSRKGKLDTCESYKDLDSCPYQIPALREKFGLRNIEHTTMYHCNCTARLARELAEEDEADMVHFWLLDFVSQSCFILPQNCTESESCSSSSSNDAPLIERWNKGAAVWRHLAAPKRNAKRFNNKRSKRKDSPIRMHKKCLRIHSKLHSPKTFKRKEVQQLYSK